MNKNTPYTDIMNRINVVRSEIYMIDINNRDLLLKGKSRTKNDDQKIKENKVYRDVKVAELKELLKERARIRVEMKNPQVMRVA